MSNCTIIVRDSQNRVCGNWIASIPSASGQNDSEYKSKKKKHGELTDLYDVLYSISETIDISSLPEGAYSTYLEIVVDGKTKSSDTVDFTVKNETKSTTKKLEYKTSTYSIGLDEPQSNVFNKGEGVLLTGWIYASAEDIDRIVDKSGFVIRVEYPNGNISQPCAVMNIEGIDFGLYPRDVSSLVDKKVYANVKGDMSRTGFYIWIKVPMELNMSGDDTYGLKFSFDGSGYTGFTYVSLLSNGKMQGIAEKVAAFDAQ